MVVSALKRLSAESVAVGFESGDTVKTTLGTVADMRLYVGMELDEAAFEELKRSSSKAVARDRALEILSRRQYSARELKDKLTAKGLDADEAAECVGWLEERGYINDAEYARSIVRHYAAKGCGPARIRAELGRRGVGRELWDEALDEMPEGSDKLDEFISRRLSDPNDRESVRKVGAALFRRGYSWDEIKAALRRFSSDLEED